MSKDHPPSILVVEDEEAIAQGLVFNPGGSQGTLCLGGAIGRLTQYVMNSGAGGRFSARIDLGDLPAPLGSAVDPGETWHFQAWFRDHNPGPTSNFSDAVSVPFQ